VRPRAVACRAAIAGVLVVLGAGCDSGGDSNGARSSRDQAGATAPTTSTAGHGRPSDRRFVVRTNTACLQAPAGVEPGSVPGTERLLRAYARQNLARLGLRLEALRGVAPPAARRAAVERLRTRYEQLLALLQQAAFATGEGPPPDQMARLVETAETGVRTAAGAAGLPACGV
jgi:hypothetical protein